MSTIAAFFLMAMQAATAPASGPSQAPTEPSAADAYADCVRMAAAQPARADTLARRWIAQDGGAPARHCLALAQLQQDDAAGAAKTLAEAARMAESSGDRFAADLYGQAGNAALLAEQPAEAADLLGRAIISLGRSRIGLRAQLLVDRARALAEQGKLDMARTDLFAATRDDTHNHSAWLLLAAAERRSGNLVGAESAITKALALAPDDPDTLREAALIATAREPTPAAKPPS
ncbi:hypothetical protein KCG44_03875 [Pacificimonas sp. WHA3]|uniref:Tetratricopeptide repeat protein n=1 Tax=Pacificimonas pallii TaxID=2827236 RepID=A0ABS6SCT0_9SPHN|nr:tetratricopeptide repeat protein [Pacificimonas pallii]MBV7255918.1 hypothetical protein [Pacificimonas pallii]